MSGAAITRGLATGQGVARQRTRHRGALGHLGCLFGPVGAARFSRDFGLLRLGADDDPAGAGGAGASPLGALDRSPRAVAYGLAIGLLGAGGQMVLFYAVARGPAYLIFSDHLALARHHDRAFLPDHARTDRKARRALGIMLALLLLPTFDFAPTGGGAASAPHGCCQR